MEELMFHPGGLVVKSYANTLKKIYKKMVAVQNTIAVDFYN